jgi:methionine-rich copper-binding protein CopC
MTRTDRFLRRLSVEPLERRQLLCGSAAAGSSLQSIAQSALLARSHSSSAIAVATSNRTNSASGSQDTESFLVTTLTNSAGTVIGTASYETDTSGNQKLVLTVVGAAASTTYAVSIDGTDVGTALTTDANGNAQLILTSATTTTNSNASSALTGKCGSSTAATGTLPTGFTLAAGDTISLASSDTSIDPLSGTFATATGNIGEGGDGFGEGCHGDNGATVAKVVATLSDSATASGKAVFTTITHSDGTTDEVLRVRVTGAAASTDLEILIDGTSVGTLSTDANGNGYAIFSSNPRNSHVGQLPTGLSTTPTSISVGTTITGTFGSSTTSGSSSSSLASASRLPGRRR